MATRYQHVTDPIRADIAMGVGGLIWKSATEQVAAERADARPPNGSSRSALRPKLRRR